MRYLIIIGLLAACNEPAELGPVYWERGAEVDLDASWNGGATPRERIDAIDGTPGQWVTFSPLVSDADVTGQPGWVYESELTIALAPQSAIENCFSTPAPCSSPLLGVTVLASLSGAQGEWTAEIELCMDPDLEVWGTCTPDEPAANDLYLETVVAPIADLSAACSADIALRLQNRSHLRALPADLVARCGDGTVEELAGGAWHGEGLDGLIP